MNTNELIIASHFAD